ncbi:MarR family winged helix-turn-helix transcriptional regulator [Sphingomonas sp.]|jgi:DNA-binding MarR family transcriptional regulator|uniref:MarR family winged helix-turn-helix transcriptional regulator n=1 Tax=Sphingomonas sp. TaxID=28214 RepID=UPI0035C7C868
MQDYVARLGGVALGARLRRLSAAIDADAARAYAAEGIAFEQRWFGVLNQLARNGPMTVGALADALGISHPSVSETRRSLEAAGLAQVVPDSSDGRRRTVQLSQKGHELVARTEGLWRAFDIAADALDKEAGEVTIALDRLDQALKRRSLLDRVRDAKER